MKLVFAALCAALLTTARLEAQTNSAAPAARTEETIVCVRHGEKPKGGLGQLSPQGLNRALALPDVLLSKYGKPGFIFAPSTAPKEDSGVSYNYIRPLMTIEPTAIRCGLPVNTEFGFKEIKGLENELRKPEYRNETVFMAWEHTVLDEFARDIVKTGGGNPGQVPSWPGKDFDTIFLIKITRSAGQETVTFTTDHEGLDNMSTNFPAVAKAK